MAGHPLVRRAQRPGEGTQPPGISIYNEAGGLAWEERMATVSDPSGAVFAVHCEVPA